MSETKRPHGNDAESEYQQAKEGHILGRVDFDEGSDDLKGTSDNPRYGVRGDFTPLEEMADPNGESPLDALLKKEEEELGAEAIKKSVADDEVRLESARQRDKGIAENQPRIRIVEKEPKLKSKRGVLDDLGDEYEDFENLPTRQSSRLSVTKENAKNKGLFPKRRGRREGVRPPAGAQQRREDANRGQSEETKNFFKDIRKSEEEERGMIKKASEYVKRNMRKLLRKEKDQRDQLL